MSVVYSIMEHLTVKKADNSDQHLMLGLSESTIHN
jgi:hypothetical protein